MNAKPAIFLSAGIPDEGLDYWKPNILAIREAVLALVSIATRKQVLAFGGHPAISPLVEHAARSLGTIENIFIYQSAWFEGMIPPEARAFPNFKLTRRSATEEASLREMRNEMLSLAQFSAAVFVGGMRGILDEFEMFRSKWPNALILPIASTGGAARILWENGAGPLDSISRQLLVQSRRYKALFRRLLDITS